MEWGNLWEMRRWQKYENLSLVTVQSIPHLKFLYLTTTTNLLAYVFVGYQSKLPELETMKDVLKNFQENIIDVIYLVVWPKDHCQQTEYLKELGSSVYRHWRRKWNATFCKFNHSRQLNIFPVCNIFCQNQKLYVIDVYITHSVSISSPQA